MAQSPGPNNEHVAYCDYDIEEENPYFEKATAAFIVRACNVHRDLIDALEALLDRDDAESLFAKPVLAQARAAIAKAKAPA